MISATPLELKATLSIVESSKARLTVQVKVKLRMPCEQLDVHAIDIPGDRFPGESHGSSTSVLFEGAIVVVAVFCHVEVEPGLMLKEGPVTVVDTPYCSVTATVNSLEFILVALPWKSYVVGFAPEFVRLAWFTMVEVIPVFAFPLVGSVSYVRAMATDASGIRKKSPRLLNGSPALPLPVRPDRIPEPNGHVVPKPVLLVP